MLTWVAGALNSAFPVDDAQRRYRAILRGAASAVASRGLALSLSFVAIPFAVSYLGAERYGAWMTISSMLTWLTVADLGIGNGLTNALSATFKRPSGPSAQGYVASSFWALAGVSALLAFSMAAAWPWVDWADLLHVMKEPGRREIAAAVAVAFTLFLLAFPFMILEKIYLSFQQGALANAWALVDSVAGLVALLAATLTSGGLVGFVAAVGGAHLAVAVANAWWLFWQHRPDLRPAIRKVEAEGVRRLGFAAAQFFAVQIIGILLFSTDNIIVARVIGVSEVTPYSVAFKLFSVPLLYVTLHAPYLWPAYAEARARGDGQWIRRAHLFSVASSSAVALILAAVLASFGQSIIRSWAGPAAVPSKAVLWWMAAWAVVCAPATAVASMLSAIGQLRGQIVYGSVAAFANTGLSIFWARAYGPAGVIAGTVVSYTLCAAVPASIEAARILRRLAPTRETG